MILLFFFSINLLLFSLRMEAEDKTSKSEDVFLYLQGIQF